VPGMTRRRLQLWGDPQRLAGFNPGAALEQARQRLGELRADVEVTHIEQPAPDSVRIVLLAEPSVTEADLNNIAATLRDILSIGVGAEVVLPEGGREEVRGIGGSSNACPGCKQTDGTHRRGCPYASR
jgi:hypothetical protein